ncbi:MAG: right-handed parallel beta-helix repeat-containing protein [Planctomycetaceae bacterium]
MINNWIASTFLAFAVSVGFVSDCFADDVAATDHVKLARLLEEGNGSLVIPAGTYEFGGTLEIDLTSRRATSVRADGPVTILMKAPGPAIRVTGTLNSSADPQGISDDTWLERMPLLDGIGILGAHEEADGIELVQTMQAVVSRVHIRKVRNAITLSQRNRNVIISNVHVYHNSGIGLFLNEVNLHQINVANSHISYNREGGIVVRGGNVRNLHVTGCDIEANMPNDTTPTESGNVFIDCRESGSVAEVAITGNTIQHSAHYAPEKQAPGGANIRIVGREDFQPNMITITGNVMSDTHTHLHLKKVVDTTVVGNTFFTTEPTDILVEECERIALANNVLNPRESSGTGQVVIRNSSNCTLLGLICHNLQASAAAITLHNCQATRVSQCIISGSPNGVKLDTCTNCSVTGCTVTGLPAGGKAVIGDVEGNDVDDVTATP